MKIKIIFLLFALFCLGGFSAKEPEEQFTVTALAFESDKISYNLFLQANDPEKGAFTLKGEGKNFEAAFLDINTKLTKQPSFSHCETLIFSFGAEERGLEEIFRLCDKKGVPLRAKILFCESPEKLLKAGEGSDGYNLISLVDGTVESFGFGGHTAFFEILTAQLVNKGDFAIINIDANEDIKVTGLRRYEKGKISENLNIGQSIDYAKKNKIFEEK
jgi:hypothetical protein